MKIKNKLDEKFVHNYPSLINKIKIKINDKNNYHLFFYCIEKSKILAI